MTYMLDTNPVSYIVKGRSPAAREKLLGLEPGDIACVSSVTEAEIKYGLAKRPAAARLRTLMEAFLASIRVLSWGRDAADAYGALRARLESSGRLLGSMDLMIAAHAIAAEAALVTRDGAFQAVEELSVIENWATDL